MWAASCSGRPAQAPRPAPTIRVRVFLSVFLDSDSGPGADADSGLSADHRLGNKTGFPRRNAAYPPALPSAAARKTQGARAHPPIPLDRPGGTPSPHSGRFSPLTGGCFLCCRRSLQEVPPYVEFATRPVSRPPCVFTIRRASGKRRWSSSPRKKIAADRSAYTEAIVAHGRLRQSDKALDVFRGRRPDADRRFMCPRKCIS